MAPFNMYNAYKIIADLKITRPGINFHYLLKILSGIILGTIGLISGYNANVFINDIWPQQSTAKKLIQYPLIWN